MLSVTGFCLFIISRHFFIEKSATIKQKLIILCMNNIHNELVRNMSWYARWHNNSHHHRVHFLALFLVLFFVSTYLYMDIQFFVFAKNEIVEYGTKKSESKVVYNDSLQDLNDKVIKALSSYSKAQFSEKSTQLENLRKILIERKVKMLSGYKTNKQEIENLFLPPELAEEFPEEVKPLLETDIELTGTLSALFIDAIEEKDSRIEHSVISSKSKKEYKLHFGKNPPQVKNGDQVSIQGKVLDSEVWLNDGGNNTNFQVISPALASDISGVKSLIVILVNFIDNTSQSVSQTDITNAIFNNANSTNSLIKEGSYNTASLTGVVTPWYTIDATSGTSCDMWTSWVTKAEQAATAGGYNPSSYNYVMYYLTGVSPSICNWGGQAYIGGRQSAINGAYADHGTKAHELGHNFGSYHSGSLNCGTSQIAPIATCAFDNYGERNAKMGALNNMQFNSIKRSLFTWIPVSQVVTVSSPGVYTLASDYSTNTVTPKILKIAKPDTSENYYITYKQALGFNASLGDGNTRGASVYLKPNGYYMGNTSGGPSDSILLSMQPGSGYANSALWDGGVFNDPANGITITQLSHTVDTVTISVSYPLPVCITSKPSVTISPVSMSGGAGKTLNYSVTVKNNNSIACSSATYNLSGSSIPSGWSFTGGTAATSPGASVTKTISVTSNPASLDGSYIFTVTATDVSDTGSNASVNGTYVVYTDVVGPTLAITSPINGSSLPINVTLSASAMDVSVVNRVEFYMDGVLLKTFTTSSYTMKWNTKKLARGAHIFLVKAYDAVGNMSQASVVLYK